MREPELVASDPGPWSRLIEEHRRNAERLEAAGPELPPWWGFPLGLLVPWMLFGAAVIWRRPSVVSSAVLCFAMLVPVGMACVFVKRLQTVTVGIVLGMYGSAFAAVALFG